MIKEIYLVPHSHTDVGYTHPQPVVLELHRRFLDEALDLVEATADRDDGSAFRWMVEVSGTAIDWWRHATSTEKDRLVAAAKSGAVEIAGMQWNQAHLSDHHMLIEAMRPVRELREAGIPIRSAMNVDVNGANWGLVEVLGGFGIEHFSMAINEHFGHAVQPRPQAFRWQSPTGRELLVYNGLMYGVTVSGWLGIPGDMDRTQMAVPRLAELLEERGYPHSVLIMQATNILFHDNARPNPDLPDHVRRFNETGGSVRLRIASMGEAFDRLREDGLDGIPIQRGDWPDWWTFGSGSTARETAVTLAGQRALRDGQQLSAWAGERPKRSETTERQAAEALALYVEHTYTADRAARKPDSQEADIQIHWKKAQAYNGYSLARMLRRDGLAARASQHKGTERSLLIYNPLPVAVRGPVLVPKHNIDVHKLDRVAALFEDACHILHRQDVELGDVSDDDLMMAKLDLPAMGYAVLPYADLAPAQGELHASEGRLNNERVKVQLNTDKGGVFSLRVDGRERIDAQWDFGFGVPVLEIPEPRERISLYGPVIFNEMEHSIDLHQDWHPNWTAHREAGRLEHTAVSRRSGFVDVTQSFRFSTGETARVRYRLAAGGDTVSIETTLDKHRLSFPHSYYLPLPLAMGENWAGHYETAGAVVELDAEQLPGSSQHFIPTQRFIRLQDEETGMTVGSPDTALFQVGGFTFGRHHRGKVKRDGPVLLAWLNNNYWDTNFEVTQSGPIRTRLHLAAHDAEPVSRSIERILPLVNEPSVHFLKSAGAAKGSLLGVDSGGLMLTGTERQAQVLRLFFLNPDNENRTLRLSSGELKIGSAHLAGLDGSRGEAISVMDGALSIPVAPRAWVAIALDLV
ncbi:glycoside hydrolase family 38 N-terminal domain-containing protein [Cucumibacter marinus]|uniref:glycoside hydrolase family 38 N-terminal domain-containing protein n=1 Tax=Cucumibacter marinus TaxID=1121252 RepID=UPI000426FEE3|nr:hypothetical protein [Cucumibacter marinus]